MRLAPTLVPIELETEIKNTPNMAQWENLTERGTRITVGVQTGV